MGKSPTTDRAAELTALIEKNAERRCSEFFVGMPESQRRELAPATIAIYKQTLKLLQAAKRHVSDSQLPTACVAVLATASLSELKKLGWRAVPEAKIAFDVLRERRPEWLTDYAEFLLAENPFHWPLVRTLVRRGLCDRPTHENYTLAMITTIDGWRFEHMFVEPPAKSVIGNLRADPDLLQREVWELFRVEGQGEHTLAAHDKYVGGKKGDDGQYSWAGALCELAKTGELPRDRLLDESLEALNRGFSQFRVAWFSELHELLEPTVKERISRLDKYLVLLASPIPPTVTFALDALEVIDKERKLTADELLEPLSPVLMARHKGTAVRAVQWLARLCDRAGSRRDEMVRSIAGALAHEAADVQKAALAAIEKYGSTGDAQLCDTLAAAEKHVAASLRKRVAAWLEGGATKAATGAKASKKASQPPAASKSKKAAAPPSADLSAFESQAAQLPPKWRKLAGLDALLAAAKAGHGEIAALDFGPLEVPRLDPAAKIDPLDDLDSWIDACAHYLENRDLIDEGERVLDGISRLCGEVPADFERRIGPLAKRVEKLYRRACLPFVGYGLWHDVIGTVRAWLSGQVVKPVRKKNQRGYPYWAASDREEELHYADVNDPASLALSGRSLAVAAWVAQRRPRPLLSAPTHRGGWLDPLALVERLGAWQDYDEEPPTIEAVLALLRLAPDNRAAALKRLSKQLGELADAVRYAMGAEKVTIGKSAPLWIAAARARDPLADDPQIEKRFPELGPDAGTAARYDWRIKTESFKHDKQTFVFYRMQVTSTPPAPKATAPDVISVHFHQKERETADGRGVEDVRWSASWWPAGPEAHFAAGARQLGNNLDWSGAEWANKTYLDPLLDPDTPLGEMGKLVLCLGLSAKEPGEHTLAADALAAAISDGRVDGQRLVPTLARLLTTAGIKPGRWAKVLADVARLSPLHRYVVRQTLENTLAAAPEAFQKSLKDLHLLLELLVELLAETGEPLTNAALRKSLSATAGGGKLAKAAKALLSAGEGTIDSAPTEAIQLALAGRMARAKRWMARSEVAKK